LEEAHVGLFERDFHQGFVQVLDHLTLDAGRDIWVEKTPVHLHYIKTIQSRIPQAKFIHTVRNGADVVASLYKATNEHSQEWALGSRRFRGYSVEQCVARWNHDVQITARWVAARNHFLARYEELVDNPTSILRELSQFLGVEYTDAMIKPERAFHGIVRPEEEWKTKNAQRILGKQSQFDQLFGQREKDYIVSHLVEIPL
jgi:hypothetical protein